MGVISVSINANTSRLAGLARGLAGGTDGAARASADALRDDLARRFPRSAQLHDGQTKHTADQLRAARRGNGEWVVEMPEFPSRYLIEGTRAHTIRPVRAQALRFAAGGGTVYARVVHHPGTRANRFAEEAARAALPGFLSRVAGLFR